MSIAMRIWADGSTLIETKCEIGLQLFSQYEIFLWTLKSLYIVFQNLKRKEVG